MIKRTMAGLAIAATAVVLSACSAGSPATVDPPATDGSVEVTTLRVASMGLFDIGALKLGIEQGFFADRGLELELSTVPDAPSGLAAVQSGQLDIVYTPIMATLNALSQGVPVQIVGPASGPPPQPDASWGDGVYVSPDSGINSVADLEGKTVAIPARRANGEIAIADAMVNAGADPATVNWVVLDFASAFSSLQDGSVDAAMLLPPAMYQADAAGFKRILSGTVSLIGHGAGAFWMTGTQTADAKPEAIAAFQEAIIESNIYANANVEAAMTLGLEGSGLTLEQIAGQYNYWPEKLSVDDIKALSEKLVKLGFLDKSIDLTHAIFGR